MLFHDNYHKFRLVMEGGERFIRNYLRRFSRREDENDFTDRLAVTYNPAFAKAAVLDIRNGISQRLADVTRSGGGPTYQSAIRGAGGGVDNYDSTMDRFIGGVVLTELLSMGKVGVYVDMPPLPGPTKLDAVGKRPYAYIYPVESILDDSCDNGVRTHVKLCDGKCNRELWLDGDIVYVQAFGLDDKSMHDPVPLQLKQIPFAVLDIGESLLQDAADFQIALLNIGSGDMAYLTRANFPFYVEQYDPRMNASNVKTLNVDPNGVTEIKVGVAAGRRYPINTNQPAFIAPPTDPVIASMAKQEQLKKEIREIVLGNLGNLTPKNKEGESTIEAGLRFISLELEYAERFIAQMWASYTGEPVATVNYPDSYDIKSDEDRRKEAKDLEELMAKIPSMTFQKEIAKRMAAVLLGPKIATDVMAKIESEIDTATAVTIDPTIIRSDFESGFVSLETASKLRGYPEGEVEQAKKDHAERIARIAISQTQGLGAARGVDDLSTDPNQGKDEKTLSRMTEYDDTPTDKTRGEADATVRK